MKVQLTSSFSTYYLQYVGIGWSEHDEDTPHLIYKKWHLKDQVVCVDVALLSMFYSTYTYLGCSIGFLGI